MANMIAVINQYSTFGQSVRTSLAEVVFFVDPWPEIAQNHLSSNTTNPMHEDRIVNSQSG